MKIMKKLAALILVAVLALTVCACHPKNEIAVKINGVEFTSAYYMCALLEADAEARSKVDEAMSDKKTTDTEIDYIAQKVDGKDYSTWVKNRALEILKTVAAYKLLCKENKLEFTKEEASEIKTSAESNWAYSGLLYEPNGVSLATYKQYELDLNSAELYFKHLYGKEGTKAVTADEISKYASENLALADVLSTTFTGSDGKALSEEEIKKIRDKYDGYVKALQDGSKTFDQIYHEDSGKEATEEEKKEDNAHYHSTILGTEETGATTDNYETVKAMTVGEVKLVEKEENGGLTILVKRDLLSDTKVMENIDNSIRHLIKDKDFEKEIKDYEKTLKVETVKYAVNRFKVKKIDYTQYNEYMQSLYSSYGY